MSLPESTDKPRGLVVPKAKADIYTTLLAIALAAILIAIILLAVEIGRYGGDVTAKSAPQISQAPSAAVLQVEALRNA